MKKAITVIFNNGRAKLSVVARTEATSFSGVLGAALREPALKGTCPSTVQAVILGSDAPLTPMGDKKKGGKR